MVNRRLRSRARGLVPTSSFTLALAIALACVGLGQARASTTGPPVGWWPGWLPGDLPEGFTAPPSLWGVVWMVPGTPWGASAVRAPGLLVALDPETRLPTTPSAAQRRAAADAAQRDDALLVPLGPLPVERLPGGGEIVHLEGRFQIYSVARRAADGRVTTDCVLDPAAAKHPRAPERRWEEK